MAVQNDVDELIKYYSALESVGESILANKQQLVELDAQRNRNREALRELQKAEKSDRGLPYKSWICFNDTFIKIDTQHCIEMLKGDQKNIEDEISRVRREMKDKVSELHEMEGKAKLKGFDLKSTTMDELSNITRSS